MKCYLLNGNEYIIHAFNATDAADARQQMVARCLQDKTTYSLAICIRRGVFTAPPPTPNVVDEPA